MKHNIYTHNGRSMEVFGSKLDHGREAPAASQASHAGEASHAGSEATALKPAHNTDWSLQVAQTKAYT